MKINDLLNNPSSRFILIVILINCILAVTSFTKDVYMAAYLGTSSVADAFLLSYFIVDTLGNNLLATALGVAVIPVFAVIFADKNRSQPRSLIASIILWIALISLLITVVLFFNRTTIISYLGSGLDPQTQELAVHLLIILIPVLTIFPLNNLGMAILQVNDRFGSSSNGPVVFNGLLLIGLMFLYHQGLLLSQGVYWLGIIMGSAVIGQFLFIWYFVIIKCQTFPDFRNIRESFNDQVKIGKVFLPYLLVLGSTQAIYTVERYLATELGIGTLAALNYAFRLVQFPIWVFVAAVAIVAFPEISRTVLSQEKETFTKSVYKYLFICSMFTVPITIILYVLRYPIIQTLFQRGEFDTYSVQITAIILSGYVFCIVWQGLAALLIRVSMAIGSRSILLKAALLAMIVNLFLLWYLVEAVGPVGIGYAAAGGTFVNALMLYLQLRKHLTNVSGYLRYLIAFVGANVVLLLTCIGVIDIWFQADSSQVWQFIYLVLIICVCIAAYISSYLVIRKILR